MARTWARRRALRCSQVGSERPLAKDVLDRLPRREIGRQETPGDAALEDIKDGANNGASVGRRSSALTGLGEHRFEESPRGVGEASVVGSDLQRSNRAELKFRTRFAVALCQVMHAFFFLPRSTAWSDAEANPTFTIYQTGSKQWA